MDERLKAFVVLGTRLQGIVTAATGHGTAHSTGLAPATRREAGSSNRKPSDPR